MIEYVDPTDKGERFVPEYLSGSLWGNTHFRWAIVDRNTGELMRKRDGKRNGNQPDVKGKFIWRGDKAQADWWVERLNAEIKPRGYDPGSGPDMQARRVDVGVLIGQARRKAKPVAPPPMFARCDTCQRCHRIGACPR